MAFEISELFVNLTIPLLAIFLAMIALIMTFYWKISGVESTLSEIRANTSTIPSLSLRLERLLTLSEHRSVSVDIGGIKLTISPEEKKSNATVFSFLFSKGVVNIELMVNLINKEKWTEEFEKKHGVTDFIEVSSMEIVIEIKTIDNNEVIVYLKNMVEWLREKYIPEIIDWKENFDSRLSDALK